MNDKFEKTQKLYTMLLSFCRIQGPGLNTGIYNDNQNAKFKNGKLCITQLWLLGT